MKKLLAILALNIACTGAFAQHRPYPHHGHGGGYGWGWVVPAVIGGTVVYAATRPPVYVQPTQPVVIQQNPPVIIQGTNCSPWTQVQNPDGSITTTRTCTQ